MSYRQIEQNAQGHLVFRSRLNLFYPAFFTLASLLYAAIAVASFYWGQDGGYLSAALGIVFAAMAETSWVFRSEVTIETETSCVHTRAGTRWIHLDRLVPFRHVMAVRVTLASGVEPKQSQIELLVHDGNIRCPSFPCSIRQEALLLAMTIHAPLIKVFGGEQARIQHRPQCESNLLTQASPSNLAPRLK
jgi:hypothetical protein